MGNLMINGKDALQEWGARMGDDFINSILSPAGLKEFVENESGLEHGKRVIVIAPKLRDRDVTLSFTIEGSTPEDYFNKYTSFVNELQKGSVCISVLSLSSSVYKLIYQQSSSFAMNTQRTFSQLAVKFCEPNPGDRIQLNWCL